MELQAPRRHTLYSLHDGSRVRKILDHPVVREASRRGPICQVLLDRLNGGGDEAAFELLFRETSFDALNLCLGQVKDRELAEYVLESVLQTAALLSSEAFTGIEPIRRELRSLKMRANGEFLRARLGYDRNVEVLGQYFFAIGRRLQQIEMLLARCPFSGSAEQRRGLYGQRMRDLAGDIMFMRQELSRWVRRFVPIDARLPAGDEGRSFLQARITAVVDDLGLRLKEVHEIACSIIFEQLALFDGKLTRKQLFKRDLENQLDLDRFLGWFGELMARVRDYDAERRPEQLAGVKDLLRGFRPEQFPALSGVRESDHHLFARFVERILRYEPMSKSSKGPGQVQTSAEEDPVHVFLLLLGDLLSSLNHRSPAPSPSDVSPF